MCHHSIIVYLSMLGIVHNGSNLSYSQERAPRRSFSAICTKLFQIPLSHLVAHSWTELEQSSSSFTNPFNEAWIWYEQVSHSIWDIWISTYGSPRSCHVQIFCPPKRPKQQVTLQISPHNKATLHIDVPVTWRFCLRNKNRQQALLFQPCLSLSDQL